MFRTAYAAALLLVSLGGPALAQENAPKARQACMSSAQSLCATEVAAHDHQAVKLCLFKNLDKVTPDCRDAINAAVAARQAAPGATPPKPN